MLIEQLRTYIIRPSLQTVSLWSAAAENLMMMTVCAETQGIYFKQEHGPALGIYQIEPSTHDSIKKTLGNRDNKVISESILAACFYAMYPSDDALIHNLRYATLIARMVYHRHSVPLPNETDYHALAEYYVKYYNAGGKATPERAYNIYMELNAANE